MARRQSLETCTPSLGEHTGADVGLPLVRPSDLSLCLNSAPGVFAAESTSSLKLHHEQRSQGHRPQVLWQSKIEG